MSTVNPHQHSFDEADWPFADTVSAAAFTTRQVMREAHPVLLVSHDDNGDWQFLCGTTRDTADLMVVCLGCMFERDRGLAEIAGLPLGWQAERSHEGGKWELYPPVESGD